jgi:hypothetical protein
VNRPLQRRLVKFCTGEISGNFPEKSESQD